MKLTKRIAAGLLAVAMMATMAAPAFAVDGGTGTSSTPWGTTSAQSIPKSLSAPNGHTYVAETYTLTAEEIEGNTYNVKNNAKPTFSDVEVKASTGIETNKNDFNIILPEYTKPGKYVYKITETSSAYQTGENYQSEFYMQVEVVAQKDDNGNMLNALEAYVTFSTSLTFGDKTAANSTKIEKVTNRIETNTTPNPDPDNPGHEDKDGDTFDVTKKVTGNKKTDGTYIDPTDTYEIEVTLSPKTEEGKTYSISVADVKIAIGETNDKAAQQENVDWTTNQDGSYTTIITLKNKETAFFSEVPLGAKYTVVEKETSKTGFTVTGEVTAQNPGTISEDGNEVTITNAGQGIQVDTGVILDNAPYIVMIAVVAAAAVVFAISKKRREE